jgi:cytochrome c553
MRKALSAIAVLALASGHVATVLAEGSPDAGKQKSAVCAACHGVDGNSVNPEWPSLAGQHASYIVAQLQHYQQGTRSNELMSPQAAALQAQDMADLAAYFSSQSLVPKEADPDLVSRGEQIYKGGDTDRGITACIACHGPGGQGNPLAGYPKVAGQHAAYLATQLRLYASGDRTSDPNQMMRNIAGRMTENDIKAAASYMQGLR